MRLAIALTLLLAAAAQAQPTAFTYQGRLKNGAQPAVGLHDFRFTLFNAATGGAQLAPPQCVDNILVTEGLFVATIDFGQQFATISPRFLEIEVRADTGLGCATPTGFVVLSPRQPLTAAPLATQAGSAFSLGAPDGSPASAVFVDNSGNVGIGTTAPAVSLQVAKPGGPVLVLQDSGATSTQTGYVGFWNSASAETGWVGYDTPGSPNLSVVNARSGGHLLFQPGPGANVGIGTSVPAAKLDVRGDIRMGATGQLSAAAGEENLRILRGVVLGNGTIQFGTGFSVTVQGPGWYRVTFQTAFAGSPAVTLSTQNNVTSPAHNATWNSLFSNRVDIFTYTQSGAQANGDFSFIAAGPR